MSSQVVLYLAHLLKDKVLVKNKDNLVKVNNLVTRRHKKFSMKKPRKEISMLVEWIRRWLRVHWKNRPKLSEAETALCSRTKIQLSDLRSLHKTWPTFRSKNLRSRWGWHRFGRWKPRTLIKDNHKWHSLVDRSQRRASRTERRDWKHKETKS